MTSTTDRARAAMLSDPLLEQLRRLSRQTGVETSITHDAAEVRQKLRIHAPYGFFNELHLTTRTMFKSMPHAASAPVTPRHHDEPGLAKAASTLPLPHVGHPVVEAAKADVAASGAFLTEPALDAEDEPADAPASPPRLTPSPPAAPPVRTAVPVRNARPKGAGRQQGTGQQQGGGRPISPSGSPPKGNPFVKTTAGPAMTTSEQLRGGAMYLGDSNVLVASAAKYLAEVQESGADNSKAAAELLTSKVALPPSQTAVLSRVIASAERLALELAHAVVTATADSQKAVEAARLQALRSHIAGLRTVQQQCHHMQMMAEHRAEEMLKRLKVEERERKLKQQENSRLRWALSRGQVIDLKENAAMAFLEVGGAKNSKVRKPHRLLLIRPTASIRPSRPSPCTTPPPTHKNRRRRWRWARPVPPRCGAAPLTPRALTLPPAVCRMRSWRRWRWRARRPPSRPSSTRPSTMPRRWRRSSRRCARRMPRS
jgi:hypothetical protein